MGVWVYLWVGLDILGNTRQGKWSKVRVPSANTSRGNGSLGQAQFGEASGEAEELLT